MKLSLLFFLTSLTALLAQKTCEESIVYGDTANACPAVAENGDCCRCDPVGSEPHCEGCVPQPCPTTTTTTTLAPITTTTTTTTAPTTTTTTEAPVTTTTTTTEAPPTTTTTTTECTCPPAQTCPPTTITNQKSGKSSKPVGCGVGDCDCEKGVAELRFKYLGAYNGVKIQLWYDKDSKYLICEFANVQRGQQVTCNLRGGPGLLKTGLYDFANETPFIITGPNGYQCAAQYHTSCSQDIVGVVQPECPDLVVSGWRDVLNVDDATDDGDCDDGITDDCDCDEGFPTITTTTSNPILIPVKIGDFCYCDTSGGASATTTTAAPSTGKKSKGGKSKGKKGSKKGKGNKKGEGLGIGDCDCEGGQTELTMMYSGDETVDIDFFHKDGQQIGTVLGVKKGGEAVINVLDYKVGGKSVYSKLGTNTFLNLKSSATGGEVCQMSVHTSCSRDIVGTYGNDGHNCGTTMIVSGWKDANNEISGGECDDGLTVCNCDDTVYVPENNPLISDPKDTNIIQIVTDVCYCSTVSSTDDFSDILNTIDAGKANKAISRGYGRCSCEKGIRTLRFVYLPRSDANVGIDTQIVLGYNSDFSEVFCIIDDVQIGQEYECKVEDAPSTTQYAKLNKETYIKLVDPVTGELLPGGKVGNWHTSCSADIIGWAAQDEPNVVVTGWADNNHAVDEDCDDGWEACVCKDCTPYSVVGNDQSECAKSDGCYVNDITGECDNLDLEFYKGSGAKEFSLFAVIAIVAVITLLN